MDSSGSGWAPVAGPSERSNKLSGTIINVEFLVGFEVFTAVVSCLNYFFDPEGGDMFLRNVG
jgi:hypothetical protein